MMRTFLATCLLGLSSACTAWAGLAAYDARIAADHAGGLPYIALGADALEFDTFGNEPFDFGPVSGSATIEFILAGDPVGGGPNGYLAVGSNATWNLRYEQWNDTGQLGFTHLGVADYLFGPPEAPPANPLADSPTEPTHVAFRWDQPTTTMELYVDGVLAGVNGSATGFRMPFGFGFLGNNAGLTEGMLGTIDRVTIYDQAIDPAAIRDHAEAWGGPGGSLAAYDAAIAADHAADLPYEAIVSASLEFDTFGSEPFDFGLVFDSATFEFILSGDPLGGGPSAFLAVGEEAAFSLRYEQWNDTGQFGFTHGGVADYLFLPPDAPEPVSLASPTEPTHVVYRWDEGTATMELYLDGVLAGVTTAGGFQMPTGPGFLGNNAGSTEGMAGVIERVTVYDEAIDPAIIAAHAEAWLAPDAGTALVITEVSHSLDPISDEATVALTWRSRPGARYLVSFSDDLISWIELDDGFPSGGDLTTFSHTFADASAVRARYYRVAEQLP